MSDSRQNKVTHFDEPQVHLALPLREGEPERYTDDWYRWKELMFMRHMTMRVSDLFAAGRDVQVTPEDAEEKIRRFYEMYPDFKKNRDGE